MNKVQCTNPVHLRSVPVKGSGLPNVNREGFLVPCGKCAACRIAKTREWSLRLLHELAYHETAAFITLTYSDEFLPADGQLDKTAVQNFYKRLRKNIAPRKISHYSCGEYGDLGGRPHYHGIVFGLSPHESDLIVTAWPFGRVSCDMVEAGSIRYVTSYVQKKLTGQAAIDDGRVQPFALQSKGLGLRWAEGNERLLRETGVVHMDGTVVGIPRYYIKKLEISRESAKAESIAKSKDLVEKINHKLDLSSLECSDELEAETLVNMTINHSRKQKALTYAAKNRLRPKGSL